MSVGGLAPMPSDALVTPVTFRVKKRQLRGLLAEFDALESGTRELSGEWIVGRRTWQRLQAEWKAAHPGSAKRKERVILYIHGGASLPTLLSANLILQVHTISRAPLHNV